MNINWQDVLITIGSSVGGGTVILGAAAWLIKKVLDTKLTRDIEAFKAELQRIAVEHEVRFARLHTTRAKVIADLYGRLVDAERDGDRFVKVQVWDAETRREAYETTERNLVELYFFVEKNRIYLPEPVCELLKDFVLTVRGNAVSMNIYAPHEPTFNQKHNEDRVKVVSKVYGSFQDKLPAARKALESEFRTILGG